MKYNEFYQEYERIKMKATELVNIKREIYEERALEDIEKIEFYPDSISLVGNEYSYCGCCDGNHVFYEIKLTELNMTNDEYKKLLDDTLKKEKEEAEKKEQENSERLLKEIEEREKRQYEQLKEKFGE